MRHFNWMAVAAAALLWSSASSAQTCVGDCNEDGMVAINELIIGVNIALGTNQVSACPSFDTNDDGMVAINELIAAVNAALSGCGGGDEVCGDGQMNVAGEECDDGNNFGGDGCAANCTTEDERIGVFNPDETVATVQTEAIPIVLNLTGQQTFRTGHARPTDTMLKNGGTVGAGQIPAAIRASELNFDPVKVTGLVCACVRGIPVQAFGPILCAGGSNDGNACASNSDCPGGTCDGISANGSIGCGDQGLTDISYRMVQDHNTTPGSAGNVSMGTPNDPECDDTAALVAGQTSMACLEGSEMPPGPDTRCSKAENTHIGVCQGPRVLTFSGGMAPKGSALIVNSTAIGLLGDAGACDMTMPMRNGKCLYEDYGPDCVPCTDDDLEKGNTETNPTTTGSAEAALFDANNSASVIDKDRDCFGTPCATQVDGAVFDCSQLTPGSSGGLSGGSLGVCFTSLDAKQIGDNVTCTVFSNQ